MKTIKILGIACIALMLSACVTTTDSRFTKKASPEKAVESYVALGISYLRQGNHQMARKKIERALSIDPESAPAHGAMALFWQDRGEAELAQKEYRIALGYDDEYSLVNYHYGRFLMVLGDKKACQFLRKASLDIDYAGRRAALEDLGLCYYSQKQIKKSITAYEKAWQQESSSLIASMNLSAIYVEQKRFDLAQRWFKRFETALLRSTEQHTPMSLWLGIQIAKASRDRNAEANYAFKLKKSFPRSTEYQNYLKQ